MAAIRKGLVMLELLFLSGRAGSRSLSKNGILLLFFGQQNRVKQSKSRFIISGTPVLARESYCIYSREEWAQLLNKNTKIGVSCLREHCQHAMTPLADDFE